MNSDAPIGDREIGKKTCAMFCAAAAVTDSE